MLAGNRKNSTTQSQTTFFLITQIILNFRVHSLPLRSQGDLSTVPWASGLSFDGVRTLTGTTNAIGTPSLEVNLRVTATNLAGNANFTTLSLFLTTRGLSLNFCSSISYCNYVCPCVPVKIVLQKNEQRTKATAKYDKPIGFVSVFPDGATFADLESI